ncbi:hypothetical protein ACFWA6_35845 [Streptomyces sp. NPDC060020]|uniref:hypothetical protein n=1 Tax=Streptomyces sp. NPDC060020 TaxID=3347038 RepID=UPI0036A80AF2
MTARTGTATGIDVERRSLRLGAQLTSGGQGHIHELSDEPGLIYKEFYNGRPDPHALDALVKLRQRLPAADRAALDAQAAWPLCRVTEGGTVLGFLMNRVPAAFAWQSLGGKTMMAEVQYLLRPAKPAYQALPQPTPEQRLELARAYVALFGRLHDWGLVFGDVSHANLLWTLHPLPAVHLIDCDGARRIGSNPVLPQAHTPDWDDPLAPAGHPTLDSDRYKAALLAGRVLACDPYLRPEDPWHPVPGTLNETQRTAVERLLRQAAGPYGARPDMRQWASALSDRRTIPLRPPTPRRSLPVDADMLDAPPARRTIQLRP